MPPIAKITSFIDTVALLAPSLQRARPLPPFEQTNPSSDSDKLHGSSGSGVSMPSLDSVESCDKVWRGSTEGLTDL
jgi:hypothetical protein